MSSNAWLRGHTHCSLGKQGQGQVSPMGRGLSWGSDHSQRQGGGTPSWHRAQPIACSLQWAGGGAEGSRAGRGHTATHGDPSHPFESRSPVSWAGSPQAAGKELGLNLAYLLPAPQDPVRTPCLTRCAGKPHGSEQDTGMGGGGAPCTSCLEQPHGVLWGSCPLPAHQPVCEHSSPVHGSLGPSRNPSTLVWGQGGLVTALASELLTQGWAAAGRAVG